MDTDSTHNFLCRKWVGAVWLSLEVAFVAGTIFGFNSIFKVLPKYGVYDNYCTSATPRNSTVLSVRDCDKQTKTYQNALTLGLIFFNIPAVFIGILIDRFGLRFVKLFAVIFHTIGWLALGLAKPGQDYLIFIHTIFTSFAGIIVLITAFASSAYFARSRALVSTVFGGANVISAIWYSIFQIMVNADVLTLPQLSYIWSSFGFFLLASSFLFFDWNFPILNLPYNFDIKLEQLSTDKKDPSGTVDTASTEMKWYSQIYRRAGIWEHLSSPSYIMVVLFVSILLIPVDLLSITWYPRVYYLTNQSTSSADNYTNAFNLSILSGIIICPISGFLLGFRSHRNRKQKVLNILIVQTFTWTMSIISCIVCTFVTMAVIIPSLILNCIARSMIVTGPQAIVATIFPSKYIGTLSGAMSTSVGVITFVQYGLVQLTQDVPESWRAWLIVLGLEITMLSHLIQLWFIYLQEKRSQGHIDIKASKVEEADQKVPDADVLNIEEIINKF